MKKIYRLIILCLGLFSLAIFTGCDDEPADINHTYEGYSILGTWDWEYTATNGVQGPVPAGYSMEITFTKYGTWNSTWESIESGRGFSKGSFSLEGNVISLIQEETNYWAIISLDDSRLHIRWNADKGIDRIFIKD